MQAMAQYLMIWDIMHTTNLSPEMHDQPLWRLTEDRQFSASSAYKMFFMASVNFACAKPIWKSKAPPRCKFFMWLVVHRRCLTADNLQRRNWPSHTCCHYASQNRRIAIIFSSTADSLSRFGVSSSYGRGRISSRRMMASRRQKTGGALPGRGFLSLFTGEYGRSAIP
jgi:hypothetical protein